MESIVFVLIVIVSGDGIEREWKSYNTQKECLEVVRIITRHREKTIQARCEKRVVE
jgi:hypothetical protein